MEVRHRPLEGVAVTSPLSGRRVLVTGHTGFKGTWLSMWLGRLGAHVGGFALEPDTTPALFSQLRMETRLQHIVGDVRNPSALTACIETVAPDVIFHLAAQPLVLRSYRQPQETWATNVLGTVNLLEAVRAAKRSCAVVVVTTDKVYHNREWVHAYRETDRLGGHDPYSASKAATELVVDSYRRSFFADGRIRLASARSGNVIGGGDWAQERIIPDLIRALASGNALPVRNPAAIRPWQHVLDPLRGYIMMAERLLAGDRTVEDSFNFAPDAEDQRSVRHLVERSLKTWPGTWLDASRPSDLHEAGRLQLATEKAKNVLGWSPVWNFETAVDETIGWYRDEHRGTAPEALVERQISMFEADGRA